MLELAKQGAGWLHDFEGWGVGKGATVVEDGKEPPEVLRHLEHAGGSKAREVRVAGGRWPRPPSSGVFL